MDEMGAAAAVRRPLVDEILSCIAGIGRVIARTGWVVAWTGRVIARIGRAVAWTGRVVERVGWVIEQVRLAIDRRRHPT